MENSVQELLTQGKNSNRRGLVFCETLFQLFNMLVILLNYPEHAPFDAVLTDDSDFSRAYEVLSQKGPFENVYRYAVKEKIFHLWHTIQPENRDIIGKDPGAYIDDIELEHSYTDLWVNLDTMAPKMFYYRLLKKGMTPQIHLVDEGVSSYILDFSASKEDFINHKRVFGELAFQNRCTDMWLCEPRLFAGDYADIALYAVPKEILKDSEVIALLQEIYGEGELPEEKYIFFEESFAAEGRTTNDIELFRTIADIVGKDNIIIKRHPRNPINRFSELGYKVMEAQSVPWEMLLLTQDVSDKVLISVGSSATISPFFLYGMQPKAFLLKNLLIGKVHYLQNPKMEDFYENVLTMYNKEQANVYIPQTEEELALALEYVHTYFTAGERLLPDAAPEFYDFNAALRKDDEDEEEEESTEDAYPELDPEERKALLEAAYGEIEGPCVSMVVPVYNTEKYLRRCLDSLVFQTVDRVEILVVNDGSTDNSQAIIDEYAARFPGKVVPLIKENGGLSSARKFGTEHATGKYIGFVDSDDWVDYRCCELCLEKLLLEQTKAVAFTVNHVYADNSVRPGRQFRDESMEALLLDGAASFWSKIYEREYFTANVRFLDMWYEDIPVINPMLSYLDKVSILQTPLYYYVRDRKDSITNSRIDFRQLDFSKAETGAIERTNPKYRKYQLVRSISRILFEDNLNFKDHSASFIKSYEDELRDPEVRALFEEAALERLDAVLSCSESVIPAHVFLNGFDKTIDKQAVEEYYTRSIFWNGAEAVWLDEGSCDMTLPTAVALLAQNRTEELVQYFAAQQIVRDGGFYIDNGLIFSATLNRYTLKSAVFGFLSQSTLEGWLFAGVRDSFVIRRILDFFEKKYERLSFNECAMAVLVGQCALRCSGITQELPQNAAVYSADNFSVRVNDMNTCTRLSFSEDMLTVTMSTAVYEATIENLRMRIAEEKKIAIRRRNRIGRLRRWAFKLRDRNERYQQRLKKRDEKIEKLNNRIQKRDEKIDKLQVRIDNRDRWLAKYKKKASKYDAVRSSLVVRAYLKLYRLFNKKGESK